MSSHDWRQEFAAFTSALQARCEAGARTYGDTSFRRPPAELVGEMEEEALDIAGWGFILWARLRALRERADTLGQATRQP